MKKTLHIRYYICLHIILILYSAGGIFSKLASKEEFLSIKFMLFYGIVLINLIVYAFFWQQILKKIQLNIAYANKAVTLIWTAIWGVLIFHESITWNNVLGGIIVLAGVILTVTGGEKKDE